MDIPQLERYYTWIFNRREKLHSRLSEFGSLAMIIQSNCKNQLKEFDKMTAIRKTLIRSGIKTEPVQFLGEFSRNVEEYRLLSNEILSFEKWVKSNGGHLKKF
jgi:hypothetical protein